MEFKEDTHNWATTSLALSYIVHYCKTLSPSLDLSCILSYVFCPAAPSHKDFPRGMRIHTLHTNGNNHSVFHFPKFPAKETLLL